jgi:hypothetical protein
MLRSFARTLASSGILLLFPAFVQAQALSFSVGTAIGAPGQKSTGYLEVPAGVDAATMIPLKSPAPLSLFPLSTFNPSNKRSPMLTLSITKA